MKVVKLPEILRPATDLVEPRTAMRLAATQEGLDLGILGVRPLPSAGLRGIAVCSAERQGAELPVVILYFEGTRRPFMVDATRIRLKTFGVTAAPRISQSVRQVVDRVLSKLPDVVIDDGTERFLRGAPPRPVGLRIIDLSIPFGAALEEM